MPIVLEGEEASKVFLRNVSKVGGMEELAVMFESDFLCGDFSRSLRQPVGKEQRCLFECHLEFPHYPNPSLRQRRVAQMVPMRRLGLSEVRWYCRAAAGGCRNLTLALPKARTPFWLDSEALPAASGDRHPPPRRPLSCSTSAMMAAVRPAVASKRKGGRIRTVPMPGWAKVAIEAWDGGGSISDGLVLR
jgi:hypothetical protein